jgi:signal transduction histidine kinase
VALVAAAGLQVGLGLQPLEDLRAKLGAVRQGRLEALPSDYPSEIQPLANEVNALLATQASTVEFARARAADLAHGLKTPLTVMRTLGPRLTEKGDTDGAELLSRLIDEMNGRVAYQLRLSRLRHRTREHHLSVPLEVTVRTTIEVLRRTPYGETLNWVSNVEDGVEVDIDRQDLGELVGTILENASKWAMSEVRIRARRIGGEVEVIISDDGPGLPPQGISELGKRGQRLDETTDGSGLGISIAREIVAINGGSISFGRADEGGLLVRIVLVAGGQPSAQNGNI